MTDVDEHRFKWRCNQTTRSQIQPKDATQRRTLAAANVDRQTLVGIFPELKTMVEDIETNGAKVDITVERVEVIVEKSKKQPKQKIEC